MRFSPALANKPKSNKSHDPNKKPADPFSNPSEGLLVSSEFSSHFIVLNKYPVIPDHFILATKEYKLQTNLLEEDDIGATYECLAAFRENGEELFGFFNSGEHSGASQPHRHIQFLPVESMKNGLNEKEPWDVLATTLAMENIRMCTKVLIMLPTDLILIAMPLTYFASEIEDNFTTRQLYEVYIKLHDKACQVSGESSPGTSGELDSPISYNLGFTSKTMIICPRTCEGIELQSEDGEWIGPVSLNGTVLGGTLLVKSKAEWDLLRSDESKLKDILCSIGIFPSLKIHSEKI